MSSAMLSVNHLACLADGLYQILKYTDKTFLTENEQEELLYKFSKGKELTASQIFQKLYKLNKKAFKARYSSLLDDKEDLKNNKAIPEFPLTHDTLITIPKPDISQSKSEKLIIDKSFAHFSNALNCYLYQISGMGIEEKKTNVLLQKLHNNLERKLTVENIKLNPDEQKWFL